MRIASFDIGVRNFSFCVEEFDVEELKGVFSSGLELYNENGTVTDEMAMQLEIVYGCGKLLLHENVDISITDASGKPSSKQKKSERVYFDRKVLDNLTIVLQQHNEILKTCDTILIEEQMAFGQRINILAVKLAQHCYSYFVLAFPHMQVIYFPAYYKTQVLGCPKVRNSNGRWVAAPQKDRKKWSAELAEEILRQRDEITGAENMAKKKKRDDLGDTLLQIQAYKYMTYVQNGQNGQKVEKRKKGARPILL
jgi:hypothetical protein